MIKKSQFLNLIRQGDFKELFISELGWNRYRGYSQLPSIVVDEKEYNISTIAERNGFQILYCEVDEIPTQSLAKKIDTKLRRQALDYICIYRLRNSAHDLWVVPVRTNEKRDLVLVEYDNANAEVLYQKIDGFTFDFDEETNIVDLRNKVQTAFAINSEKITKDFYAGFKKQHKAFAKFISGIDDHIDPEKNKNKHWYASVILNRLMFCYFIQKKGFLNLDVDYLRNKLNYVRANEGENQFYNFYRDFLRRLFHNGLNAPKHSRDFEAIFGKIPYLNGGMFDEHQLEHDYADIDIPDEAFIGLFDFFDKWNWHLDTRLTASGKDINPDVLGYIFEQYINDRAQMGAYYTKEDITEYIGRNCILPFLFDKVRTATADSPKAFAPDGFVWKTLRESGDRYIFDAVKKGYKYFNSIPESISRGLITEEMRKEYSETPIAELPETHVPLSELRSEWNTRTPEQWGLPNEIWRETIERLQRCNDILDKINRGEITSINDFITYNLDIRTFATDLLAKADNRFVGWFYHALQEVSILDPTCGSGAFLFAAMNILEPLYEICIDRMQEFNQQNPLLFKNELAEITDKYRSNIQYFIFKSIILRNLYGVDIMVEATEIAKLRLFLKMVAVVDVDRRADNLGLDPLPDIDFNIRCGNTLVGYATKKQLDNNLSHADDILQDLANQDFKQQIEEEMRKVAAAYRIFVYQQLRQEEDILAFKQAKHDLNKLLKSLNDKLNHRLHSASSPNTNYEEWLKSHQPFNWLSEFYQIIEGNHGFDVIIGNPPYVVYSANNFEYSVNGYTTIKARNLYAFCIERALSLINNSAYLSMIVPISISNGNNYKAVRDLLYQRGCTHYSHYAGDSHPSCLFTGVQQNLTIFLSSPLGHSTFTTNYIKFYTEERFKLYSILSFCEVDSAIDGIIRYGTITQRIIGNKIRNKRAISIWLIPNSNAKMYFKNTSGAAYKPFFSKPPYFEVDGVQITSKTIDYLCFRTIKQANSAIALFNSNLFNFLFYLVSDARHITPRETLGLFYVDEQIENDTDLHRLSKHLEQDYHRNSSIVTYNKKNGITKYAQFNPRLSKPIMDEIDTVLARHYGFTEEELDFIINYDIKYRMGDELNNSQE
ncbi:MAG: Eco57I restriction-modification methylase domain-containing protein [Muribaculaceae bacterium]|nr:Eco57I restriction-modification methylase domain-containing protein [Muribaculaceae bacterium]